MTSKLAVTLRGLALSSAAAIWLVGASAGVYAQDAHLIESLLSKVDNPETLVADVEKSGRVPVVVILKTDESAADSAPENTMVAAAQDRFLASFLPATESSARRDIRSLHRFSEMPFVTLNADTDDLRRLSENPYVARIEQSFEIQTFVNQSVPEIGGTKVHSKKGTGKGTTVVVIDTGVESSHGFLRGRVVHEACFSVSIPKALVPLCPNGKSIQFGPGSGTACKLNGCSHGTHVAGIAAGRIEVDGGGKLVGVAPRANIIAIQAFSGRFNKNKITSHFAALMVALDYVLRISKKRTDIVAVNLSIGGPNNVDTNCDASLTSMVRIIDALRKRNIATIFAAGNDGTKASVSKPGCISSAVTVGATDKKGVISHYSNMGKMIDLMAPGGFGRGDKRDILSAVRGNKYNWLFGTSMAAPHVTGAFAAIRSIRPNATVDQIEAAMKKAGVTIRDSRDGGTYSAPYLNIDKALAELDRQTRGSDGGDDAPASGSLSPGKMNELLKTAD